MLQYGWSAEVVNEVADRCRLIGCAVEDLINERLQSGELSDVDLKVRYVPIIMPPDRAADYPARSKVSTQQRLLDCAPQLNFDAFSGPSVETSAEEYLQGLIACIPLLETLGMDAGDRERISDFFKEILAEVTTRLQSAANE
jgi:hypothetical protein